MLRARSGWILASVKTSSQIVNSLKCNTEFNTPHVKVTNNRGKHLRRRIFNNEAAPYKKAL